MSDPARQFATDVVRRLRDAGYVALFAGGCVRDLLLQRPAKDYDVATTATPDEVRKLFGHRRTLAVGASFGVVIVLGHAPSGDGQAPDATSPGTRGPRPKARAPRTIPNVLQVEVATFRRERDYSDGRRPDHVEFCSPEEDARRRDFTINGMFYDPVDGRVLDYVGGEHDLAAGIVRAIGEPRDRMREDKLRMLRAVRFAATLEFQLDPATAAAVRDMAPQLNAVSAERIAQELKRMLVDAHRRRAVELCRDLGLLPVIFPELSPLLAAPSPAWDRTLHLLQLLHEPRFEVALAALLHPLPAEPTVRNICLRLRLSNEETGRTTWLVAHQNDLRTAPDFSLAQLKRALSHPHHADQLQLLRAKLLAEDADLHPVLFCEEYLARTPPDVINPPPLVTGNDLIQIGLTPGPPFKELLETIRDAQLNGDVATRDDALRLAAQLRDRAADGTP
jgi:poly(A) polymerase